MPNWCNLTNLQWMNQIKILARKAACLQLDKKQRKGDQCTRRAAYLLADHVKDVELRKVLQELFKAEFALRYKRGQNGN